MRITRNLLLVILGVCLVSVLHEMPAHAQAPGSSTSSFSKAPTSSRPSSSALSTKRSTAPKSSLSRVQTQGKTSRVPRQSLRPSSGPASKSQASLPFAPDNPFADSSSDLFEPKSRTNAATIASAGRHQYHPDPKSGVYANKSIPQIRTRRGGMGRMGMGGMGMGGMGMGGMGMMR
jgi:hypothetical protein